MLGEDGSYGGSPCVDIHLNDMNIDLAGLTILEDANLTLVRAQPLHSSRVESSCSHTLVWAAIRPFHSLIPRVLCR